MTAPTFTHLRRLTDAGGLYEHARGSTPRPEHGYCVDDVARALVVVCRDPERPGDLGDLREQYLAFVLAAQAPDGRFRNRRAVDLSWSDGPSVEDCWGRALWGLGHALSRGDLTQHHGVLRAFRRGAAWRSPWVRSMSFAALGAAQVLRVEPGERSALDLLSAAGHCLRRRDTRAGWPWPEPRLTYANAAIPEAMIEVGSALGDENLVTEGLRLLGWLLALQTRQEHLSMVPATGWGPGQTGPAYDQQPIEVATLADACACALRVTGDPLWLRGLAMCAAWFDGDNDSETPVYDLETGAGYDGLERTGRNDNRGAESTLALLSTQQQDRLLSLSRLG